MHHPSEMPYRCESCGYRTSSHKDVIDHYYKSHEKCDGLQCPYCIKVIQFVSSPGGQPSSASVHAYLMHMQRHIVRREEKLNKCPRCCLWFNQMSTLKAHVDLHTQCTGPSEYTYTPCVLLLRMLFFSDRILQISIRYERYDGGRR